MAGADDEILAFFHLNGDGVIQAIGLQRLRAIEHVVLVAQFVGDVFERLIQIFHLEREERLTAGLSGEVPQDLVAVGFDALDVGGNGVDDDVGLLRHFERLIAGIAALVVVAIAEDDHGAAEFVARLIHASACRGRRNRSHRRGRCRRRGACPRSAFSSFSMSSVRSVTSSAALSKLTTMALSCAGA